MVRFEDLAPHHFLGDAEEGKEPTENDHGAGGRRARKEAILQIVKAHPDGIPVSKIADALDASNETVRSALRELEKEREVYHKQHEHGNAQIWYPNGRLVHPYLEVEVEVRGKPYKLSIQEARQGPAVQLQEKSYSLLRGERVEGAIFVPYDSLDDLIESIEQLRDRYENFQDEQESIRP